MSKLPVFYFFTEKEQAMNTTINQLIEKSASHTPEAIAVSCDGITITYKELNERANQLAHFLIQKGVQNESFVGISLERSIEMIIGVLGILKSGGTYIPIDPSYPNERIHYMLMDSKLRILITQQHLEKSFNHFHTDTILIDSDSTIIQSFSTINPSANLKPDNLAYVLYTSGSTGNPKGVMVSHRSVLHAYQGWKDVYELSNVDNHLQLASFSFDVFTGDFIRALGSGAKLTLCPREFLLDPKKLFDLMITEKINCAEFVPTVLRKLMQHTEQNKKSLGFMRLLVCGSDNWSMHEYRKLQSLCGDTTRVINSYGLTEATIDSSYFEDRPSGIENFDLDHAVPLGRPFPNTEILILNSNLQEVSPHEAGEIYIGGAGLAKGYLNRPDLSFQRFIPHPFKNNANEKLYKTGDLGRALADGNIQFLGRIDTQIKLRGMRIELSDIENVLNKYSDIKESIVIVEENPNNHKHLVAYIVTHEHTKFDMQNLRQFLQTHLPDYMVPAFFIKLAALPLTPNGKLNRQGLSAVDKLLPEHNYIAPRNAIEQQLAAIWKKLLSIQKVGVRDNFSDLGGDSFLLATLVFEVENIFFVNFMKRKISKTITIEDIATIIQNENHLLTHANTSQGLEAYAH